MNDFLIKKINSEMTKNITKIRREVTDYVSLSFRDLKQYKKSNLEKVKTENMKLESRVNKLESAIHQLLSRKDVDQEQSGKQSDKIKAWTKSKLFDLEMKIKAIESKNSSQIFDIKSRQLESKVEEVKVTCVKKLSELQTNFMRMVRNYRKNLEGFEEVFGDKSNIFDALDDIKEDLAQIRQENSDQNQEKSSEVKKRKTIFSLEPDSSVLLETNFDRKKRFLDGLSQSKKNSSDANSLSRRHSRGVIGSEYSSSSRQRLLIPANEYYGMANRDIETPSSVYKIKRNENKHGLKSIQAPNFNQTSEKGHSSQRNISLSSSKSKHLNSLKVNLKGLKLLEHSPIESQSPSSNFASSDLQNQIPRSSNKNSDMDLSSETDENMEKFDNPFYERNGLRQPTKGTFDYSVSNNTISNPNTENQSFNFRINNPP